jgi:hypothetical protein
MKYEGKYKIAGKVLDIYSDPNMEPGVIHMFNPDDMKFNYPLKKNGKPDMRYDINKWSQVLNPKHKSTVY